MNISILLLFLFCLLQLINCYNLVTKSVSSNETQSRVMGNEAKLKQFSWQAAITVTFKQGDIFCGGARISRRWILTSATCVKNANHWHIVIGTIKKVNYSEGAFSTTGVQGIVHERFNSYLHNNLGLIKLAEVPIHETDAMKPIKLQTRFNAFDNLTSTKVTVSGWGSSITNYREVLLYEIVEVLSNEVCKQIYGENIIVNETLCANSFYCIDEVIIGDNGAPLVMYDKVEPILVGIASFSSSKVCNMVNGKLNNAMGFTRTGHYLDWIQKHTDISVLND